MPKRKQRKANTTPLLQKVRQLVVLDSAESVNQLIDGGGWILVETFFNRGKTTLFYVVGRINDYENKSI